MEIAFIHPRFPGAEGTGATHSATQIVNGLATAGHEIGLYCPQRPDRGSIQPNITLHHLSGASAHPHTDTKLNREIEARAETFSDYDVVHSYLPSLIPSISQLGKRLDVSTVITLNAYRGVCPKNDLLYRNQEQCGHRSTPRCIDCIGRSSFAGEDHGYLYTASSQLLSLRLINVGTRRLQYIDGFRAPAQHVRDNYVQFGFDPERISVIPHPVDEQFLVPHQSDFEEPYQLLYVGSLSKHKGVEKLVPILASLNEDDPSFELTIVGTGGLERALRGQVREYDVEGQVTFTGFIPNGELPNVYAAHDCLVYPCIWEEPLARVYLEALATGTPVVTRGYGTISEILGEAGQLADGSTGDFRKQILHVVEADLLPEMSTAAKEQITRFRVPPIVRQIETMYETATSRDR